MDPTPASARNTTRDIEKEDKAKKAEAEVNRQKARSKR
jgi:hypothetical protein